jgi:hypothetical protein
MSDKEVKEFINSLGIRGIKLWDCLKVITVKEEENEKINNKRVYKKG